ncbi:HupE/UreJ family protein [Coraliomargarita parva]|uniref:HupE/UreJ family protein n=1 Tax=Coraliomargarita parva TaxID=3014050 RepID=UPI0022B2B34F|nr:HupE/UreJ family protein [Coraliomargarita parva]
MVFEEPGVVEIEMDTDLTRYLDGGPAYYALTQESSKTQSEAMARIFKAFWAGMQPRSGDEAVQGELLSFTLPEAPEDEFGRVNVPQMTRMLIRGTFENTSGPFWLQLDPSLAIEYPIATTFQVPAANRSMTRWVELANQPSQRFNLAKYLAMAQPAAPADGGGVGTTAEVPSVDMTEGEAAVVEAALTFWRYIVLGFHHIFPKGMDHILFILGVFLMERRWKPLVAQTSVFTVAHTTTLGLSAYGVISLPAWFVEPAIAATIAFVALEDVFFPKLGWRRYAVVFGFGLIHGLGFAGVLGEVGLPREEFLVALLGFNFGVDFGQLFVLGVAFLCVGWFWKKPWYRKAVVWPAGGIIAAIGLYWLVERVVHYAGF